MPNGGREGGIGLYLLGNGKYTVGHWNREVLETLSAVDTFDEYQ